MKGIKPALRRILAANLKKHRKTLGLSQEKLAELAGLSWQTVNSIECHRTWVSEKTLESLADVLQIDAFQQFGVWAQAVLSLAKTAFKGYDFDVEEHFIFKPSAFKHDITEADILNAFERRLVDFAMPGEEHKNLLIGLARNGSLLEIIYNVLDNDVINVFHAMKCRKAYYVLIRPEGTE